MATLRRDPLSSFDVRGHLVAELRGHYLVDFPGCPFNGRADLLERLETFEFPQRWIDREHWLTRNPDEWVVCGADGTLSIDDPDDAPPPPAPNYPKPTR